ncbi:MAG: ATP-dependent 6-phosphofructokinase [Myxococcota bacterium]
MIKRVGIMTGGGDCPGLNAVIRAAVRVGARRYGWEMVGIEDAFHGLIDLDEDPPPNNRVLTDDEVRGIFSRGGTILGTSNKADPFRYAVVRDGKTVEEDISDLIMTNYRKLGLDALISIGGDGSMRIAQRFVEKGMNVVGVPKTIDNDLASTDRTFGFQTAVQIATDALDRIRDTAESHDRVMLVEVMGRGVGWIALEAGIAGGAHGILLPEIPYRLEPLAERIRDRSRRGQPFSVIVVAEGAKPAGGELSVIEQRAGEMARLGGAAHRVAAGLEGMIDADMRVTVLGHVQRGGSPCSDDRILATRFGHHAAELVAEQNFGKMVALRHPNIIAVPIEDAIRPNPVDPHGGLVETARALDIVFGDERGPVGPTRPPQPC